MMWSRITSWLKRPRVLLGLTVNALFLVFTLLRGAPGGDRREVSHHTDDARPRTVRLPPRHGRTKAKSFYDRQSGQTSVYTAEDLVLIENPWQALTLAPIFSVPGTAPARPRAVELRFISFSDARVFPESCRLWIDVDGARVLPGEAVNQSRTRDDKGRVVESLWVSLPYAKFLDVVAGARVKMRLGYTEVQLTRGQLDALRDMHRCTEPGMCG